MKILHKKLEQLLSPVNSITSPVQVSYAGSKLSNVNSLNLTANYSQVESIFFTVTLDCLGITDPYMIYDLLDKVRSLLLGKRIVAFDPLVSGIVEVASDYLGQIENGKYRHNLQIVINRPKTIKQEIC